MDIRNMRQLTAIRAHGSIAKAATALGMSQPSLSVAMGRLEDELKVKLFERSAQGSRLTPIGELIVERARMVVFETEQIVRDANLVAGGEAGEIRVGIGVSLKENFVGRFIQRLTDSYPALSMSILMLDRERLVPLLRARDLDLVICAYGDDLLADNFIATEILTAPVMAVAAPHHELIGEKTVSVERFCTFPSAGPSAAEFTNAAVLPVGRDQHALLRYQSNDYQPLIELALIGRATLLAPSFVVQPYLRDGRLSRIALDWSFKVSFAAVATRAASYSPIVSRVIQHAVALGALLQSEAGEGYGAAST